MSENKKKQQFPCNFPIWGIPFCFRPAKFHKTGPRQDGHNAPKKTINLSSIWVPARCGQRGGCVCVVSIVSVVSVVAVVSAMCPLCSLFPWRCVCCVLCVRRVRVISVVTVVSVMSVASVADPLWDPYGMLTGPLRDRCGFVARALRRVRGQRKEWWK